MHVLPLPPRHLLRVTLLAAAVAFALTALFAAPVGLRGSDRGTFSQAGGATPAVAGTAPARSTAVQPPLAPAPEWLQRPVTPPSLGAPPAR